MNPNLETVQSIYAAFGAGDIPTIFQYLSQDVEWEHDAPDYGVPWLTPGRGHAHVMKFFEAVSNIEFHVFEPINLLVGQNQVCAIIRLDGTYRPTGGRVVDLEAHLWTFGADGKVVRFRHLADTHQHIAAAKGL